MCLRIPPKDGLHTTAGEPALHGHGLANQGSSLVPASEIGRVFASCCLSLKRLKRGRKKAPAPLVACSGGADSILSVSFIQCSRFIPGNPEGTVVVAQSACASNKGMPVVGSMGKGSSLQALLFQRQRSRR